jgi:hypothetical protein
MEQLKDFMLLFSLTPNEQQPTPEQLTAMRKDWGAFIGGIAAQAKLVATSRLGFEGNQITADLNIIKGFVVSNAQMLSGNMIVKALNLSEATEMAKGCPLLKIGGSVEVRDIVPMES